jgi:tRNA G18 (ribose-2'-O)-methylase SpoU
MRTRRDKLNDKLKFAKNYNISLCIVSLQNDNNVGFAIRTAACFGLKNLYVIGAKPDRKIHDGLSASTFDYVNMISLSTTNEFLQICKEQNIHIISAELTEDSKNLYEYSFPQEKDIVIVIGNETFGVPGEIIHHSDAVYIPMGGVGVCLNTVMAGTSIISEFFRQKHIA